MLGLGARDHIRFFVMIDLFGTLILPATFVYLIYLIVEVLLGDTQVPVIALAMVGATYGLQAVIFLFKRQWQFIGWLVIYILAYPIYSFILPIYVLWMPLIVIAAPKRVRS
ncbi:chitin synthase [Microbotryum lychnidis-dioicae p1A1 Lamole]|uniref:Chitin synthase n=1 Tax=Microbotryum lychnidis-dioicae (strain p1A1 Lamole / MvSl-1064) TaxID=683840 RepID=U5H954_USTV1|nr:chitin synthase [Microbotryum lychnidis-dioicae p1A1 Lamole]|eukprot:KDE05936.1 chitin synthase [Microbotryum lychnidis-dioicae p1A1 Lamole]